MLFHKLAYRSILAKYLILQSLHNQAQSINKSNKIQFNDTKRDISPNIDKSACAEYVFKQFY